MPANLRDLQNFLCQCSGSGAARGIMAGFNYFYGLSPVSSPASGCFVFATIVGDAGLAA